MESHIHKILLRVYYHLDDIIRIVMGENAHLRFYYFCRTHRLLHLKFPRNLNDKIQWLMRYWRNPLIARCADKYLVRAYIEEKGCGDILNELYGVYDSADDIDFSEFPEKFVVKCSFGCSYNIICQNRESFNEQEARKKLTKWMSVNYRANFEWQYSVNPKRIVVEKFLEEYESFMEYQVFCFNGEPGFFLVRNDLGKNSDNKGSFAVTYDICWKRRYYRNNEELFQVNLPKPQNFDKMVEYAKILSRDFPHVRVDYYEVDGKLVFGELTFSSAGGILENYKKEVLDKYGAILQLPPKYNE